MKIRLRDVVSYLGRDYVAEGILSYRLAGKVYRLIRAVDGNDVIWVEPLMDDLDDRLLVFKEVSDLRISTPPPQSISYRGGTYLSRLNGQADVEVAGQAPGRATGTCKVWRFRAAGDLFLQVEDWSPATVALAGESVHKDMIDVIPA